MAVSYRVIERRQRLRRMVGWALLSLLLLLLAWIGYAFYLQVHTVLSLRGQHHDLQARIQSLQAQNQALRHELSLAADDEYLEYLARKWLGLVKKGEVKYILPPGGP